MRHNSFTRRTRVDTRVFREMVKSHGRRATVEFLAERLWEEDESRRLSPEQISLRGAWEGLVGPVEDTLDYAQERMNREAFVVGGSRHLEDVSSTGFGFIMGQVIAAKVLDGYTTTPMILDQLVTPWGSSMKTEPMPGFQAFGGMMNVGEGEEYSDITFTDKVSENPEPMKRGRKLSITEEAIFFDQTAQLLTRAQGLGEFAARDREQRGILTIQDATGYKGYYPRDGATKLPAQVDLYRTSAGGYWYNKTVNQQANTLTDWESLNTCWQLAYAIKDENDQNIVANLPQILVPAALAMTAARILGATEHWVATGTATRTTLSPAQTTFNVIGARPQAYTSPFLSSSSTWFMGDFKRQFFFREIFPLQTFQLPPARSKDVVAAFTVRYKGQVEAHDDKFVIKNT